MLASFTLVLGFILATLAVREAEREKLGRERDLEREQQRYATLLTGEIDSLFSEIEEKIATALVDVQTQQDIQKLSEACRQGAEGDNLIGDIFLAGADMDSVLPLKSPLLFSSERRRLAGINLEKIESIALFKTAESAEFGDNNLPLAVQSYNTLANSIQENSSKALFLNRLARCYKKSGDFSQALNTYSTILKDFSTEMSSEGVPLGIIAFVQLGTITQITDPKKIGQILLDFYSRLVSPEWPLDNSQFQVYRNMIDKMQETWKAESKEKGEDSAFVSQWDELEKQADVKRGELTREEDWIEKIIPLVQDRVVELNSKSNEFSRFSEIAGDNLFLITASAVQNDIILGILIDDSILAEERLPQILRRLPIPEDWLLQVVDSDGYIVLGDEALDSFADGFNSPFVFGFDQNFPPWQFQILQKYPNASDRQHNLRRNVYILVVVVVMAVLFFGGFMAIKSTAKELELARLKSEFVSTVSHEFRTPLMSIRYLSEMLDTGRVRGEDKKKIYYGKISNESERLSRLIENMLDFSKIEAGMKKYLFENLAVEDLVRNVAERFKEYHAHKPLTLNVEIADHLPSINADREGISRALFNLLDNAVKYSGKKPVIYLRARNKEAYLFLEVQDSGSGISLDEQNKVFDKFYRSTDSVQKNIEGSGIGLTLVNHIVTAHGGEVLLESEVSKGTKVILKLLASQKGIKNE
ncbi:ATP-binding protein [Acidobacteriota bacterium]